MIDVCTEEGVSPKQVFFILLFFLIVFIFNGDQEKNHAKIFVGVYFLVC